ncbi:putative 3'-5' exonuclease related to the exonuclease domain of PolB [Salinivirga cyanobacteriivorans]|uniref:Putative 3'-5' exonuclease related to the exonuclease domain of PolB n=1 Tax=Salinivirga cyanobacteriivorans TaxID=1307839 RepID=A0A0S2I2Y4_9BACT|nr:3'-5' exonuclease [Salinivirga cyanobacteriivorans]ALO16555.1 putative 3'-5' exonuclease related to the exonuclease domain of PolB [Salinivirga cyanobacteriivorans]
MQHKSLYDINISDILFLDIETVPLKPAYEELDEAEKELWDKKANRLAKSEEDNAENLYSRAGIYAEFGKIVCISCGVATTEERIRVKSFASKDEKKLLEDFAAMLNKSFSTPSKIMCAHNGKEFDFPYIARRMLVNGVFLPGILQIAGKKPWEIQHLDTMELWKFGDYKNYTSLAVLTHLFDIPTPKDDIDGSDVHRIFWEENDLDRIVTYCQKDVIATMQLFRRYRNEPLFTDEQIEYAD